MARPKAFIEEHALNGAVATFWKKGYHDTSMQDLVDNMGINRASMYDTFGDKHQLYLKALETYRETNRCALLQAIENEPSNREKVRLLLLHLVNESLQDVENKGCFFTNATLEMLPHDAAVSEAVCANLQSMNLVLTAVIQAAQVNGEIANGASAASLADFVQCNIAGLRVLAKARPTAQQLFGIVENVMRVLA